MGKPQFIAVALLLVYAAQCLWLAQIEFRSPVRDEQQLLRTYEGLQQWRRGRIAGVPRQAPLEVPAQLAGVPISIQNSTLKQDRSPLYYLIAAAPVAPWPTLFLQGRPLWRWLALAPYLFFGITLGGSLWYVTRRLYGNAGGYIALALYCLSPAMIASVTGPITLGAMGAVWGAFGTVFTAIAVAHTLYAPREVVLWNWRRILLLGLSMALAVGNQFSLAPICLVALLLMFWVAPVRPGAVVAIWTAAIAVAAALLFAAYFCHPTLFWQGILGARWIQFDVRALAMPVESFYSVKKMLGGSPVVIPLLGVAIAASLGWKRARYFGNTAPLLVALLLTVMATTAPECSAQGFHLIALVLLFVFVSGVFSDLRETRFGIVWMAAVSGLLAASAVWNLRQLALLARS